MRMKKTILLTLALLLVSGVLVGCGRRGTLKIGWRGSSVGRRMWARYTAFSGVERKSLRLEAGKTLRLDYDIEVDEGTLRLLLVDPDGETVWEKTFKEPQTGEVDISAFESGRHRLLVKGDATRGRYDISWNVVEE